MSISDAALAALDEIWDWNAKQYGADHAEQYRLFLTTEANKLSNPLNAGLPMMTEPGLRYIIIRRRRKGHGHIAVFERIGNTVTVLRFYHTAQDWRTKLAEERL